MKRFAAHYLYIPGIGFFKQYAIEIDFDGTVIRIFPLTEEIESVEWFPGVLLLSFQRENELIKSDEVFLKNASSLSFNCSTIYDQSPKSLQKALEYLAKKKGVLFPYLFSPFDFISMKPVSETQHRLLQ